MSRMNYGGETKGTGSVPDVGPWAKDADDNKGLEAIAKTQAKRGKPKTVSEEGREASRPLWNLVDEFTQLPGQERRRLYGVYSKRLAALHQRLTDDLNARISQSKHRGRALEELRRQAATARKSLIELVSEEPGRH